MFQYGRRSTNNVATCSSPMQAVCNEHIKHFDSSAVCGYRGKVKQNRYFDNGVSQVRWPDSYHNRYLLDNAGYRQPSSEAIDLYPWHNLYGSITEDVIVINNIMDLSECTREQAIAFVRELYAMQAMSMKISSEIVGVPIIWGGDWDGDTDRLDQTFNDLAHFQRVLD